MAVAGTAMYAMMDDIFDVSVKEEFEEGDYFRVTITETRNGDSPATEKTLLKKEMNVLSVDTDGNYLVGIRTSDSYAERTMTYDEICDELRIPDTYDNLGSVLIQAYQEVYVTGECTTSHYEMHKDERDGQHLIEMTSTKTMLYDDGTRGTVVEHIVTDMLH